MGDGDRFFFLPPYVRVAFTGGGSDGRSDGDRGRFAFVAGRCPLDLEGPAIGCDDATLRVEAELWVPPDLEVIGRE